MSLRVDRVQLDIIINNDPARKQMRLLDEEMKQLHKDLKKLPEGSEEWIRKNERLKSIQAEYDSIKKKIGITGMSLKELTAHQRELNAVLLHMNPNLPQFKILQKELAETNARIKELRTGASQVPLSIGKIADGFNRYFAMATAITATFAGTIYSVKKLIQTMGDLSDSLADIRKTTGMTSAEVENLNRQLGKIDTRTSRQDLRQMAVVAGQLGIAKEQVLDFVSSVDRLNVALGDEIQGGAEEVAKTMGTLRNVLTDMKSAQVDQDMLRIGNALNELGKAGFATAPIVADFANRIGGIGISLGLTSDEVLGLSATLQELNVNTERGGTAVSKILQRMTTNTSEFAKIAGLPLKEFTNLVNTDLMGAFFKVVEGAKRGGQSATLLAGIIKDLEVQGAGASEVFAKLSGNTDMLREKIDLAGKSLQGTDSITEEFNIKNATLGATIAKLQKDFYSLVTMPGMQDFFKNIVYGAAEIVNAFRNLPQFIEKYKIAIIAVIGATLVWISAKTRSIQVSLLQNIALREGIGLKLKDAVTTQFLAAKEEFLTIWKGKGTIATKLATTAQHAWNAAVKANPLGLLITGLTAIVGGIKAYDKYNSESVRLEVNKNLAILNVKSSYDALNKKYEGLSNTIRNFNQLSVQEKKDIQEKIDLTIKQAEAELALQQTKQKAIRDENTRTTLWQRTVNLTLSGGSAIAATSLNIEDAMKNGAEAASVMDEGISNLKKTLDNLKTQKVGVDDIINAESIGDKIGTATIEQLEEKLKNYQVALRNTKVGEEDYLRVKQKIADLNKQLGKYTDNSSQELKSLDDKKNRALEIQKQLQEATLELMKAGKDKDLAAENLAFNRKMAEIQGNTDQENKLRESLQMIHKQKLYDINAKYDQDELKKRQTAEMKKWDIALESLMEGSPQYLNAKLRILQLEFDQAISMTNLTEQEKFNIRNEFALKETQLRQKNKKDEQGIIDDIYNDQITRVSAQYDAEIILAEMAGKSTYEIRKIKLQETHELEMASFTGTYEERFLAEAEYQKKLMDLEKEEFDKMDATIQMIAQAFTQQAQMISDSFFQIDENRRNANTEKQLSDLERQKQAELANKNLTDEQKQAIEDKYHKKEASIKTKAWKDNQIASEKQAIINGALAVTNILATMPWTDFGIMHAISIAAAVAKTVAEVAVIKSQKMPQFFTGGFTGNGDPDQVAGVVHKKEYVITAAMMEDPLVKQYVTQLEKKRTGQEISTAGPLPSGGPSPNGSYTVSHTMMTDSSVKRIVSIVDQVTNSSVNRSMVTDKFNLFNEDISRLEELHQSEILSLEKKIELQHDASRFTAEETEIYRERIIEDQKNTILMREEQSIKDIETVRDANILTAISQISSVQDEFRSNINTSSQIQNTFADIKTPSLNIPTITPPPALNVPAVEQAIKYSPVLSQGDLLASLNIKTVIEKTVTEQTAKVNDKINSTLAELNKTLSSGIKAGVLYTDWEEIHNNVQSVRNQANP
ncbi:MAG: phage tail tape measure protein [Bacteroidales bacterium]